ncbi:cytochrome P450 [Catellatospora tritici]|uniref:cytochrome P450 n=1 Tax=Catellatospora tritici TaxID=2851566 RepID=UPI001C2DBD40|nr:cytochrome P450 [Catellatospora tritici]MBV1850129.1 cytochrome P450 [Catellatospora tritici]
MTTLPARSTAVRLPAPATTPVFGHLWRWTRDPVRLLVEGARTGPVFRLRLWRPAVVGYRPEWNRAVLGDLDTFRSRGSLSGLTPYLSAGVVYTDVPAHDPRRRELNPHFHSRGLAHLRDRLAQVAAARLPDGRFEALSWAGDTVRRMLNAAFFGGVLDDRLLAAFLHPLEGPVPGPMLPRPLLFRRLDAAIARVLADPPEGSLAAALSGMDDAVAETRVALAAGYDTTAHTLAWALWHLAAAPEWRTRDALPLVLDEILRLYPAGWLGSRITSTDTEVAGVPIPARTLVLYSPLLTHRDPALWPRPDEFRPWRFADHGRPAWGFLPFSAGRRTCLGAHLARAMLLAALAPWCDGQLAQVAGDPTPSAAIALRPVGPLILDRVV